VSKKPPKKIPTSRSSRTARIGGLAAGQGVRWTAGNLADRLRSEESAKEHSGERALQLADALVEQLGTMKGAAMKLGQVLSGLEFSGIPEDQREEFKAKLAKLRDQSEPRPWREIEKVLRSELGESPGRVFSEIEQEAFAAASIGQVHRALTREGDQVALKIQYPGVAEAVGSDMRNLGLLSPMIRKLAPGLDIKPLFKELSERIEEELDYELEADRSRQIWRMIQGHPFLMTPRVYTDLSSRRVLATEFIQGQSFSALQDEPDPVRDRAGEQIFRFYFGLLDRRAWALGDPHPGNMLRVGERMCFLDFGMIRQVPRDYLQGEQAVARAVVDQDAQRVHELLSQLGYLPRPELITPEQILEQLQVAGGWYFQPGLLRITPELVRDLVEISSSPASPYYAQLRQQSIPPVSLLIRRMEGMVLSTLGELRAEADWGSITREMLLGEEPVSQLGKEEKAFWG